MQFVLENPFDVANRKEMVYVTMSASNRIG